MTEITRVPLKPLAKGSLTKLWFGVAFAILVGAAIAWMAQPKGLEVETLVAGEGENPGPADVVFVSYVGTRAETGEEFDRSPDTGAPIPGIFPEGYPMPLAQMLPGFRDGVTQMQVGGKYRLFIPADQAYGDVPSRPGAPAGDLYFEIEVFGFMGEPEFERKLAIMRRAIEMPSGPGGVGAPPPPGGPNSLPPMPPANPQ
ncbi:MAG: FKBP-type peptidyl-prolyl cis-trans isomerase [Pseudomonadota bacterium]